MKKMSVLYLILVMLFSTSIAHAEAAPHKSSVEKELSSNYSNVSANSGTSGQTAAEPAQSNVLEEIKTFLKKNYYVPLPEAALQAKTIDELLLSLNDPYTDYMSKDDFEDFTERINQNYTGVGISLEAVKEGILVTSVFEGSPAQKAGLQKGDIITKIDGHIVSQQPLETARSYMLGVAGTKVVLTLKRGNKEMNVTVTREVIKIPLVESKLLDGNIGYIRISSFGAEVYEEFSLHVKQLIKQKATKWIIDLRSNGGGYVLPSLEMLDHFFPESKNPILKFVANGIEDEPLYSEGDKIQLKDPIILTDEFTASASEIFSYAIKVNQRGTLMGSTTFGKGVMQAMQPLSDGSILKYTSAETKSINNVGFHKIGIKPDIDLSNEEVYNREDRDQWLMIARLYHHDKKTAAQGDLEVSLPSNKKIYLEDPAALPGELRDTLKQLISGGKVRHLSASGWETATANDLSMHTVTFQLNPGKTGTTIEAQHGHKAAIPALPVKAGYTFSGWYSDSAFKKEFNLSNTPINKNTVLYAKWVPNQTTYLKVKKRINLWKRDSSQKLEFVKILQPGSVYRVYGKDRAFGGQYSVGGGYYITDLKGYFTITARK